MVKLNRIVGIEYTGKQEHLYDIEIDHPEHAFVAQSANRCSGSVA